MTRQRGFLPRQNPFQPAKRLRRAATARSRTVIPEGKMPSQSNSVPVAPPSIPAMGNADRSSLSPSLR